MDETVTSGPAAEARRWLRAGLVALIAMEAVVGVWQYFFPQSFYQDFPTVRLDPPYNEHLVGDVGGLTLALTTVLVFAAVSLEYRLVMAALSGFAVFAVTHFAFHVRHFDGFPVVDAAAVGTGLGLEVVLTFGLLLGTWQAYRGR